MRRSPGACRQLWSIEGHVVAVAQNVERIYNLYNCGVLYKIGKLGFTKDSLEKRNVKYPGGGFLFKGKTMGILWDASP